LLRLKGKGYGTGVVLGSAAIMRPPMGIPVVPPRLIAEMSKAERDNPIEKVDIILVTQDYGIALNMALPWANVVGIIAENADPTSIRLSIPTVSGIEDPLNRIEDDALLLLDGDRGVVLVDPDGIVLATYQAERERLSPRRRVFLDYTHQPARTLDGKEIRVIAAAHSLEEVRQGVECGADAIYVASTEAIVNPISDDEEQYRELMELVEAAAGKPITISGNLESISLSALMQAAARAEFTLALPVPPDPDMFSDLAAYQQEVRDLLIAEETDFGEVRLGGRIEMEQPVLESLENASLSKLVLDASMPDALSQESSREWLEEVVSAASGMLLPVEMLLPGEAVSMTAVALGLGASGLIVEPRGVQEVKELVRTLSVAECREAV
jgi:signal transduction protein with GAF and PtsI domain